MVLNTQTLQVDQDGDGMPDWWDQDEGNDGVLDVDDVKMGGSLDGNSCGTVLLSAVQERFCGHLYGFLFKWPLLTATQSGGQQFTVPYSTRPDAEWDDSNGDGYDGTNHPTGLGSCDLNCYFFTFDPTSNPTPSVAYSYPEVKHNRDLFIAWLGTSGFQSIGAQPFFQWTSDNNGNFLPDEIADFLDDDVDPDIDCGQPLYNSDGSVLFTPDCMYNNTNDLDDDWDIVYDHFDVDDDNDGDYDDDYDNNDTNANNIAW